MTFSEIAIARLINQQIVGTGFKKPQDLVSWMGAMQAQDYQMSKWAVGIRLSGTTDATIENALNKGEILRTHILRPTWHLVAPYDIRWMTELTAPQIISSMKSRLKELEITPEILKKSNVIIEKALSGNKHLTREELMAALEAQNIATKGGDNRPAHLMYMAELSNIVCSGINKGKQQTYALLDERVPVHKAISREEALAKLAHRYFSSHAPATLPDFCWWSGLTQGDAKKGIEAIKKDFIFEKINEQTYLIPNTFKIPKQSESIFLLPAFDEYIISYKDRSAVLSETEHHKKSISNNGIFRPVIIHNGQAIGIWKRTVKKDKVIIEPEFFETRHHHKKELTEDAAKNYGTFLELKTETKY